VKKIKIEYSNWVSGVSDGLTLPCAICGVIPKFDYNVDNEFWKKVVEEKDRLGVICLSCLDDLASLQDLDVSEHLVEVQFTGRGKTIILKPIKVFLYPIWIKKIEGLT
jgi:hypothetical protein